MGLLPLALSGQGSSYLYNKGAMSVIGGGTGAGVTATLYIGGDLVSDTDNASTTKAGSIFMDASKIVLTGDLYRVEPSATFTGVSNVVSLPTTYTDARKSEFVFGGTTPQHIWVKSGATLNPQTKEKDYVLLPNLVVENSSHVTVSPEISLVVKDVTANKGRLILDSRRLAATDKIGTGAGVAPTATDLKDYSILANLLVDFKAGEAKAALARNLNLAAATTKPEEYGGGVQVNLELTNLAARTEADRWTEGDPLVAFGTPFRSMRADYFMYNFLFTPSGNTIFNEDGNTTTNPNYEMKAGQGFVVGIDLRGSNPANYTDVAGEYQLPGGASSIDFASRVNEKYKFNRFALTNKNNLYPTAQLKSSIGSAHTAANASTSSAYTGEVLNYNNNGLPDTNPGAGVDVSLKGNQFNYLSNPYTTPLDLSDLIVDNTASAAWGVTPGYASDHSAVPATLDIANRVWIMDPASAASGTYDFISGGTSIGPGNKWVIASYQYRVMLAAGATAVIDAQYSGDGAGNPYQIGPLQMFVIYAYKNATMHIPLSKRKLSPSLFLRSNKQVSQPSDDFLFEVRDNKQGTSDRAAVVLRKPADLLKNPSYMSVKKLRTTLKTQQNGKTIVESEEGTVKQTYLSVVYTKNKEGAALESNFLSMSGNETSTYLYIMPGFNSKDVTIRSLRMDSKDQVKEVYLVDSKLNKTVPLNEGTEYVATVATSDSPERFKLVFKHPSGGIGDIDDTENNDLTSYYANGTLTVTGFTDADYGNVVSVYDIQGRLVGQTKVTNTEASISDVFSQGAYIVKVTGSRSYVTKFLAR